ncbi:MAG: NFACT family protein, partial [Clostridia bacterium]|nr:NFACT family protein [Clostridia bacterium]
IRVNRYTPTLISDENGKPAQYCSIPVKQYGPTVPSEDVGTFGVLIDRFFTARDHVDRVKQRAADIFKLLANAQSRLQKKIAQQEKAIAACAEKDKYKKWGDLATANIWQLSRGMTEAELIDYETENMDTVRVPLDNRLAPSQNAQRFYKRYNKAKNAEIVLAEQIEIAKGEIAYLDTVFDALTHAEVEADLDEIRDELYHAGYASRMKAFEERKKKPVKPMEFRTTNGYRVLCGKNNHQNEYITHKLASKNDYWFHVKNRPGSHVIMFCADDGDDVPEIDFTEAATIAAFYSTSGEAKHVEVDYTLVRNLKKPPQAKPGMVIYHTNWSAYVTPDEETVKRLRVGKS